MTVPKTRDPSKQSLGKGPSRREVLLDTAARLFNERGYRTTTIRDIAAEMGVLSGSLYAHIQSKEDLLYEVIMDAGRRTREAFEPIVQQGGLAADEKLRQLLRAHCALASELSDRSQLILNDWKQLEGVRREEAQAFYDWVDGVWAGVIDQGVAEGTFRQVDRRFARLLVESATVWLYSWYRPGGPLKPQQVADRFHDLLLNGLAPS